VKNGLAYHATELITTVKVL